MERDREYDEIIKKRVGRILDEPIDENIDADDLLFDLGFRYLRMAMAEKKAGRNKSADQLTLWAECAASK